MPHLKSFAGLRMSVKYVRNWYSVLGHYLNILSSTTARFKDGHNIIIHKNNFLQFYEELYVRYLKDQGFTYERLGKNVMVKTPQGFLLKLPKPPYSFVLDEIFIMRVYGKHDLTGRVVIDIGSSIGDSSIYFTSLGATEVLSFEIDKSLCYLAEENIRLNNLSSKIHVYNERATSEVVRKLISQQHLKNIFMKIDCEGCEVEIINNMDDNTIKCISDLVLEYHYDVKPLSDKLKSAGFKVRRKKEILFASKTEDGSWIS